jgi:hypothetical protein
MPTARPRCDSISMFDDRISVMFNDGTDRIVEVELQALREDQDDEIKTLTENEWNTFRLRGASGVVFAVRCRV